MTVTQGTTLLSQMIYSKWLLLSLIGSFEQVEITVAEGSLTIKLFLLFQLKCIRLGTRLEIQGFGKMRFLCLCGMCSCCLLSTFHCVCLGPPEKTTHCSHKLYQPRLFDPALHWLYFSQCHFWQHVGETTDTTVCGVEALSPARPEQNQRSLFCAFALLAQE